MAFYLVPKRNSAVDEHKRHPRAALAGGHAQVFLSPGSGGGVSDRPLALGSTISLSGRISKASWYFFLHQFLILFPPLGGGCYWFLFFF